MGGIKHLENRICPNCGTIFTINPKAQNGRKKYCSMKCFREYTKSTGRGYISRIYCRNKKRIPVRMVPKGEG